MNLMELRNCQLLGLEPRIAELPAEVHWWIPLKLDEQRIALVSERGRYYLEIPAEQISHFIDVPDRSSNPVERAACRTVTPRVALWRVIDFRYSGALKSSAPYRDFNLESG